MKDKIRFVKSIKKFGEKELGLFFDGSFVKLAEDEFSCNWVYACYKNRMQSALKDNFPYEFHSDMNKALKRQKALEKKGFDTYFYHAEAHGGKKCPITKEMLESDRARQCYVVLHEAWHATSSRNNHNFPYSFEESSGRVVGLFGGIEFAKYINDDNLVRTTTDQEKAWSMFADFINDSYKKLNDLMKKDASEEEIAELKKKLNIKAEKLYKILPDSWEKIELKKEINNAYILRYYDYTVHYPLAKSIFIRTASLQKTMKFYSELFKNASDEKSVKQVIRELKKNIYKENLMTKMSTTYTGGLRAESIHLQSGTKILTDAPLDNHGKGEAFSPTDLFTISYTTCILTTIGLAAQTHGFSIDGATAETEKIMISNPRRVGEIRINIVFPHDNYSDKERTVIERTVKACPVGESLNPDIKRTVSISYKK